MPNPSVRHDPISHDMNLQALLYASGELEGIEAASFERRLAEEQAARDALCQAVSLFQPLASQSGAGPDPTYRECVRQRLRPRPSTARAVRHPVLWALIGATAAILLMLTLQRLL